MRCLAPLIALIAVAGCGGGSAGVYDDNARDVAKRAAASRLQPKREKLSTGSVRERSDCPQAPPKAGPCLNVELKAEGEARPVEGGDSVGTVKETIDAFVWLVKNKGDRWTVRFVTYRPRDVSFNGAPYQPSP